MVPWLAEAYSALVHHSDIHHFLHFVLSWILLSHLLFLSLPLLSKDLITLFVGNLFYVLEIHIIIAYILLLSPIDQLPCGSFVKLQVPMIF